MSARHRRSSFGPRWSAWAILSTFGCHGGDDPVAMVPTSEVCGADGSHRVLDLDSGEVAAALHRFGDDGRVVWFVERYPVDVPWSEHPAAQDSRIVVTGPCGEDPVEVGTGLQLEITGDTLVGCREGGDAFALDPQGAQPELALAGVGCAVARMPGGWVGVRSELDGWGQLVWRPDVGQERVLEPMVRLPDGPAPGSLWAGDAEVLALRDSGEMIRIGFPDTNVEVVRGDVSEFKVAIDPRWTVIEEGTPTPSPQEAHDGPIVLLDREAEQAHALLTADLSWTFQPWWDGRVVLRSQATGSEWVFAAPGAEGRPVPDDAVFRGVTPDGAIWLGTKGATSTALRERRWDPTTDAEVLLYEGPGYGFGSPDGLEVFVPSDADGLQSGALLLVPWTGGEPQTLAEGVHFSRVRLADGRVLSLDPGEAGPLYLHDPEMGTQRVVDHEVHPLSPSLNRLDPFEGDIVYSVWGEADNAGAWRVRVPRQAGEGEPR